MLAEAHRGQRSQADKIEPIPISTLHERLDKAGFEGSHIRLRREADKGVERGLLLPQQYPIDRRSVPSGGGLRECPGTQMGGDEEVILERTYGLADPPEELWARVARSLQTGGTIDEQSKQTPALGGGGT